MIAPRLFRNTVPMLALGLLGIGGVVLAQSDAPVREVEANDDGGTLEIGGIDVDVAAKTATAARYLGWRLAQRKGWATLAQRYGHGGSLPDSTLDSIVSGIVVEREQLGDNRYIARLGIQFSRARAGALLGLAAEQTRSAPMLVIPVMWSGGAGIAFETKTPWLEAWRRFRTSNSTIDYVRPSATGPDSLLMNAGQILRPGRGWWRSILNQYGATNVLIPVVHLYRQWPGGPVIGTFQARFGPDDRLLDNFSLRVSDDEALPALLDAGIKRIDESYQRALANGIIRGDPGLNYRPPALPATDATSDDAATIEETANKPGATSVVVQVDTPSAGAVTSAESALRGVPGVHSAVTISLALGGISVMRVNYDGDANALANAMEARGWRVGRGNGAIRIERPGATPPPPPADPK